MSRSLGGGRHGGKRTEADSLDAVQAANRAWWTENPMTYDWTGASQLAAGSPEWFDDQDRRSDAQHRHFLHGGTAFDLLVEGSLTGKEVLEIGVGTGQHAQQLARAGARVTGIDLSTQAIALTQKRFDIGGDVGAFQCCDAEQDRADFYRRFDLVWSWGVIHHSSRTARIVRNTHNWLKPGGSFAGMVYHRDSMRLPVAIARDWFIGGHWRSHSIDEALWRNTDGYSARFYPSDQWRDLLLAFYEDAETYVQGLDVDLVPLPQPLRRAVWTRLRPATKERCLRRLGHFLLFRADGPAYEVVGK